MPSQSFTSAVRKIDGLMGLTFFVCLIDLETQGETLTYAIRLINMENALL